MVAEHLFFFIKILVRIELGNNRLIVNGKNPEERQFTRDEHRKEYQTLLETRRKAYLAVQ